MHGQGDLDDERMMAIRHNLRRAALLAIDLLPTAIVRHETYRNIRRRFSRTPERFTVKPVAPPFTKGGWRERTLAGPETDLVVEGFPGSANSWTANAIRRAIDQPVRIESHFHYTVQLRRALAHGVPTVVLLREPGAACDSLKSKEPQTFDSLILLHWLFYYRWVARHHHALTLVRFEDVTRDIDGLRHADRAVGRLCTRPLQGDALSRRHSPARAAIARDRPWTRWLLAKASQRHRQLVAIVEPWTESLDAPPEAGTRATNGTPESEPFDAPAAGTST